MNAKNDKVAILLATYNGGEYLPEQLQSITDQSHQNWVLWVSDDGSKDETLAIIEAFQKQHGPDKVKFIDAPKQGATMNFMSLLCHDAIEADYFAFCDQDDVWLEDKLSRAIATITAHENDVPILYGARTFIVDQNLNMIGKSPLFAKKPSFFNAIVQSYAGGNTMLMNNEARMRVKSFGAKREIIAHDWWVYMYITGIGGTAIYDENPNLYYRQHGRNEVGANIGFMATMTRAWQGLNDRFKNWNAINVSLLDQCRSDLTPQNLKCFDQFIKLRHRKAFMSVFALFRSGIYRQTLRGNITLYLAAFLGKV